MSMEKIAARILLVDDSFDNIFLMTKVLDFFGCTYQTAHNGEESVRMVQENEYDFILMDLHMPIMNGLTATRLIREWEAENRRKRTVIIGVTGAAPGHDEQTCRDAGMDDWIIKPFKLQDLQNKLSTLKAAC